MNLYLRFFNEEVLVENVDQALEFLSNIPEVKMDDALRSDIQKYVEGNNPYPKRFKVGSKVYFIIIKTTANNMEEFKAYAENAANAEPEQLVFRKEERESQASAMEKETPGWYSAWMKFKRVVPMEGTNKFQYIDTEFEAQLKAHSVADCYNRVVDHLRTRGDVDSRSQFPSARGRNFKAELVEPA